MTSEEVALDAEADAEADAAEDAAHAVALAGCEPAARAPRVADGERYKPTPPRAREHLPRVSDGELYRPSPCASPVSHAV